MVTSQAESLAALYQQDETAWLDAMLELLAHGRFAELDHLHLSEYLSDMAKRDRREVFSLLVLLMIHLLKWDHQPTERRGSWRATIREQRRELRQLLESGTLRIYAETVLLEAYAEARAQAADETELALETFPVECAWELEVLLNDE